MLLRQVELGRLVAVFLGAALAAGCGAGKQPPAGAQDVGALRMALVATANGHTYRLRHATFAIAGPTGVTATLDSEAQPDAPVLTATLTTGSYTIRLADGWFLERVEAGGAVRVDATLVSPNPAAFDITTGATTSVPFRFTTDGTVVVIGTGTLDVSVDVTETGGRGLTLLAGQLGGPGSGDGVGAQARFISPGAIASDDAGHLYVADSLNSIIRKITLATGEVTTIAGTPGVLGATDGTGPEALFEDPVGIAVDGANLFVADEQANTIRKIVIATGETTTFAGAPDLPGGADGIGGAARFLNPTGVASDGHGSLFIGDTNNNTIRRIDIATAQVTTLAGAAGVSDNVDGVGAAARFSQPRGLTTDGAGTLYVADSNNMGIRRITIATGEVTTLAGGLTFGFADGVGRSAIFYLPWGVSLDGAGNLFVADANNSAVRRVDLATAQVTTFVASDVPAAPLPFVFPEAVLADGAGHVYVADSFNDMIRRIDLAPATVSTIAGAPVPVEARDGTGAAASLVGSGGIASDGQGNLYVTQINDQTIKKIVVATGEVTTFAGSSGVMGYADGVGAAARFTTPFGLAADGQGSLYVGDTNNAVVRRIDIATATVTTLAGTPGFTGDQDGVGTGAQFGNPFALAADGQGNVYVVDAGNRSIRRIAVATGAVTTLAGSRFSEGSVDGVGTAAGFGSPTSLAIVGDGSLLVADQLFHVIRKLVIATGEVTTVAGDRNVAGFTDGTGAAAHFDNPYMLTTDGAGNVFVADLSVPTIRKIVAATATVTTVLGVPHQFGVLPGPLPARLNHPFSLVSLPDGRLAIADEGAVLLARF